ncbi:NAD(P)-binding protein [Zopfia rhizophila CBS 207.26]|uniref:NAD(P)-binding protein n=1 Tax=Zopfia rhizophila CBS 207.26 TaxID=1314779 RepID=A0A6A6ELU9_9PEZI|nr:NAD(P)-binding protein [Zopfia rhizophila CBS 207.26]
MPSPRRLKIAVSGLGRMGARHANHFLHRTPRAELVAAFSPDPKEIAWAKEHLEPWGVTLYKNYEEMLKHEGLEAVSIATVTTVHAEETIKAIEAGLHVLCEKPLSTKLEICEQVLSTARSNPEVKVMCGFSRRFDASYRQAYTLTSRGQIGRPTILRSQTCDRYDPSGFFVQYAQFSGGIFVDCNIHDIDLALWFFSSAEGNLPRVKSVSAVGVTALEPGLKEHGDVDNGVGIVEFHSGQIAYLYSSRMHPTGQHDETVIIGTKGALSVNNHPASNLLEIAESNGLRKEIPQTYYGRFEAAFVEEARQFTEACLEGKDVPVDMDSSVEAVRIGCALQESLRSGKKIWFDEQGNRIEESKALRARL